MAISYEDYDQRRRRGVSYNRLSDPSFTNQYSTSTDSESIVPSPTPAQPRKPSPSQAPNQPQNAVSRTSTNKADPYAVNANWLSTMQSPQAKPQQDFIPNPVPNMTHTELATDIANRNKAAVGAGTGFESAPERQPYQTGYHWWKGTGGISGGNNARLEIYYSNGAVDVDTAASTIPGQQRDAIPATSYAQPPASYPVTPEGYINTNVPGGSVQDAISRGLGSSYSGGDPSVGARPAQPGQQVTNLPSGGQAITAQITPTGSEIANTGATGPTIEDLRRMEDQDVGYGSTYR